MRDTHAWKRSELDWIRPCGISSSFGISPAVNKGLDYGLPEVLHHLNCSVQTVLKSQSSCGCSSFSRATFHPLLLLQGLLGQSVLLMIS